MINLLLDVLVRSIALNFLFVVCILTRPTRLSKHSTTRKNIYMIFAGWEVRMVKNCDRGLENAALGLRPRAAF